MGVSDKASHLSLKATEIDILIGEKEKLIEEKIKIDEEKMGYEEQVAKAKKEMVEMEGKWQDLSRLQEEAKGQLHSEIESLEQTIEEMTHSASESNQTIFALKNEIISLKKS